VRTAVSDPEVAPTAGDSARDEAYIIITISDISHLVFVLPKKKNTEKIVNHDQTK
jgi:hypothetical protein